MSLERPVVVAYDGSDESERALHAAVELFPGRRLLVVSVWEPGFNAYLTVPDSTGLTPDPSYRVPDPAEIAAIDTAHHDHAGTMAETGAATARRLGADAQALPVEDAKGVAETVVEVALEHDAAAIAMGARGQGALRSLVFGSTSKRLLHEARCPVLVVRAEAKEKEKHGH
jgi:nucleotide-binding universal stress UspA family protein